MIAFPDIQMRRTHGNHAAIELTEDDTWEGFPRFAEAFAEQLGATKIDRIDGPDIRFWSIELENIRLDLGYDDFPNGLPLTSCSDEGYRLLQRVFENLKQKSKAPETRQADPGNPCSTVARFSDVRKNEKNR